MTHRTSDIAPVLLTRDMNHMTPSRLSRLPALALLAVLVLVATGWIVSVPSAVADAPPLQVNDFIAQSLDFGGNDDTVAGGHPYEAVTSFSLPVNSANDVEDVNKLFTELPPGFLGNVAGVTQCTLGELSAFPDPTCPAGSAIGTVDITRNGGPAPQYLIFNMVPERGYPAELGFFYGKSQAILLYPRIRPRTGGYGITVASPGTTKISLSGVKISLYGVPSQRNGFGGPAIPLLSNPTDCLAGQPSTKISVDSWVHPGRTLDRDALPDFATPDPGDPAWKTATAIAPPVTGCDSPALASQFGPSIDARPTPGTGTSQADAPSGYTVDLDFPRASNDPTDALSTIDPSVPSAPPLKDATVTLPEGVAISPSAADGLDGCSDLPGSGDQVHYETTIPVTCPDASKVGTVVATTPLLADRDPATDAIIGAAPVSGEVFIVKPHPGDLSPAGDQDGKFRLLIQVNSAKFGVNLKLPGVVTADRVTGRLTARFEDNPQVPAKHLRLVFDPGQRAALVNPAACTVAKTAGTFTPWSRGGTRSDGVVVPGTPDANASSSFNVSWDGNGGACPATLPFTPGVSASTAASQAGASSPFTFDLTRDDRQDVINGVNIGLPGGLLATVKSVPLCSDADADAGSCPTGSRVGSATVAAGPGEHPFYLRDQPVSLTGPYKGAPYGLAIAVHAVAGPFDLGTVVVRQALNVDVNDAHATVVSDPLPTVRDGVPFRVRRVHVVVDRPGFMRSPSSCEAKTIATSVFSAGGQTASLATPIQFDGCDKLAFAPKLAIKLTGTSQAKVGGHPGVEALLTQQPGEAAMKSATVTLPLSLALDPDNAESDSLCEFADGLKDTCPEKSVIGTVTAISPLLKTPIKGKVFFVKGVRTDPKSGRLIKTLPTLLIELRGEINVNLRASSSVPDGKHLTTTFPAIPDAPISSFALKLNGGKKGILVVTDGHDDICYASQRPFLAAAGQNGKRVDSAITLTPECPLAVVSRTLTSSSVRVRVSGLGAGKLTVAGPGLKTTRRTITTATSATVTAKLTAKGKQMRRAKQDIRVKVSFVPKGGTKVKVAYSKRAKR
jgi:hypothetical protein